MPGQFTSGPGGYDWSTVPPLRLSLLARIKICIGDWLDRYFLRD